MTYLAKVTYRIPTTILWFIPFVIYRNAYLPIEADSEIEANRKMKMRSENLGSWIYNWTLIKPI